VKEGLSVVVADDSALMRVFIQDILKGEPSIGKLIPASNGKDAYEKTMSEKPDVVLMDMTMGDYDGLYGVTRIMEDRPTPIVILSAMGNTDMEPILEAMRRGAVDYLNKPASNSTNLNQIREEIIEKVINAARSNVVAFDAPKNNEYVPHTFNDDLNYDIVVIGASTGGPPAIETILSKLPENFALPILIVQHMPAGFVPSFTQRLNTCCPLEVVMARKGEVIKPGKVYVAPGSRNMILTRNERQETEVSFTSKTFREYNYPSVNSLMLSVSELYRERAIGVILTGMGKDGAAGMKALHELGGYTIAQSKESCVVYGMPREAVEAGSIRQVVPVEQISLFLVSCIS